MCNFISRHKKIFDDLDIFIDSIDYNEKNLINILHYAQNLFGYIPKDVQSYISKKLDIPFDKVKDTVNFYSYFTTELKGKYKIKVCLGNACNKNNDNIVSEFERLLKIKSGQTTEDMKFSLDCGGCVGMCRKTPIITINGRVYDSVTIEDIPLILKKYDY